MVMTTAATTGFNISSSAEEKVLRCFLKGLERPPMTSLRDDAVAQRADGGFLWMDEIVEPNIDATNRLGDKSGVD
jgi:hypothetical protein